MTEAPPELAPYRRHVVTEYDLAPSVLVPVAEHIVVSDDVPLRVELLRPVDVHCEM